MASHFSNLSLENKWHEDDLASNFCGFINNPIDDLVYFYTPLHYVGDVRGKTVLDIASGRGDLARMIKAKGASKVVGVDISHVLLKHAREQGGDVEYRYGNAYDLGVIGKFDYVVANRFIPFAETVAGLKELCRGFYANLKDGGRFVGVNINSSVEADYGNKLAHYGLLEFKGLPSTNEAKRVAVQVQGEGNDKPFQYIFFYHKPEVYVKAFKEAGFREVRFEPMVIDESVPQEEGFWDMLRGKPHVICIVAEK